MLGHGAGGGAASRDLTWLSAGLPPRGYRVIVMDQPWLVAGRRVAVAPARLDRAWIEAVAAARRRDFVRGELVVGGRSAGARVACRTAATVRAVAVIALAFPLLPPSRPGVSRADELDISVPLLVVQGDRDVFGGPSSITQYASHAPVVGVPGADHSMTVARSVITQGEAAELVVEACLRWLGGITRHERESTPGVPR